MVAMYEKLGKPKNRLQVELRIALLHSIYFCPFSIFVTFFRLGIFAQRSFEYFLLWLTLNQVQKEIAKFDKSGSGTLDLFEYLEMTLGPCADKFLKTLLFFKELEIKQAEEAARAKDPRSAFMKSRHG